MGLKEIIRDRALAMGFSAVGIAPADYDPTSHDNLLNWLRMGYQSNMSYMESAPRKRYDPRIHLPEARSVIVCAQSYYSEPADNPRRGYVSIYARGDDYHDVMKEKLAKLREEIAGHTGEFKSKIFVDTSPVGEKALAVRAGIGFIGRNGTVIIPKRKRGIPPPGSFHFLGVMITDLDVEHDSPAVGTCGECTRCIDACPTGAIVADGVIDAQRCISYHTTQNGSEAADEFASKIDNMIFGCDICQAVCPYNSRPITTSEKRLQPRRDMVEIDLAELSGISESEFDRRFKGTAISGIRFDIFARNLKTAKDNVDRRIKNGES